MNKFGVLVVTLLVLITACFPLQSAHAALLQTQWSIGGCPLGWTSTGLTDDTKNAEHHLGEQNLQGAEPELCVRSDDPTVTISSSWGWNACPASQTFTTLYDDAGVVRSPDDYPARHNVNEDNYRPNGSNDYWWCVGASGSSPTRITSHWAFWASKVHNPSCLAGETAIVGSHNFVHNLNYADRDGANQESLCVAIVSDGLCGTAKNTPTASAPSSNLCTVGTASAVTGTGPWNWTCGGINGGAPDSCSAPTIPNTPPTAPTISGTAQYVNTSYPFTFSATDADGDTIRYGVDWDKDGVVDEWVPALGYVASGASQVVNHQWGGAAGLRNFQVLTEDVKGSRSGFTSYSVTLAAQPVTPVAVLTDNGPVTAGNSVTLTYSCSNSTTASINQGVGNVTPVSGGSVSVLPASSTTYTLTCTGPGGTTLDSTSVVVNPPGPPATITSCIPSPGAGPTGSPVTWTVTTSNFSPAPSTITWSAPGGSPSSQSSSVSTFTSSFASAGNYSPTVTATNGAQSAGPFSCSPATIGAVCAGSPTGTVTATPNRIRASTPTSITFALPSIQNVTTSCILTGPGMATPPPPFIPSSCSVSGSFTTNITIATQSTYVLTCDGVKTATVNVNVLPKFQEF